MDKKEKEEIKRLIKQELAINDNLTTSRMESIAEDVVVDYETARELKRTESFFNCVAYFCFGSAVFLIGMLVGGMFN